MNTNFLAGEDGGVVEDGRCGEKIPEGGIVRVLSVKAEFLPDQPSCRLL